LSDEFPFDLVIINEFLMLINKNESAAASLFIQYSLSIIFLVSLAKNRRMLTGV